MEVSGHGTVNGTCGGKILSDANYSSRLCLPLNYPYVFAIRADCVLTNALRLKTTPSKVGQTSARNGALQ